MVSGSDFPTFFLTPPYVNVFISAQVSGTISTVRGAHVATSLGPLWDLWDLWDPRSVGTSDTVGGPPRLRKPSENVDISSKHGDFSWDLSLI